MKKVLLCVVLAGLAGSVGGCAYGGIATAGDKVVVARNDGFLFGLLRKVYVCKVSETGLSACSEGEAP